MHGNYFGKRNANAQQRGLATLMTVFDSPTGMCSFGALQFARFAWQECNLV
jgi:hypothetical protein